jgi:hypothetical protein
MRTSLIIFRLVLALPLAAALFACVSRGEKHGPDVQAAEESEIPEVYTGAFDGDRLTYNKSGLRSAEALWAMSQCDCFPGLFEDAMEKNSTARGVLPQILIPAVREEVKANTALQTLQKIPLGGLLADFFASDEKLAEKVRAGLVQKLERAPGGSSIGARTAFRFDGFAAAAGSNDSFVVSDQIPRWMAVFAADGIWTDGQPVDSIDHGLQLLELLRTLSEWTYLIGLDANSDGGFYGGLTLKADGNRTAVQGPVDPRKDSGSSWFLSGTYTLKYDDASSRDLATSVREIWNHDQSAVSLDEQARLWHTAARAFARLRTDNRKNVATLFGSGGDAVLPPETHTLPLAFLGGVKTLLPTAFIDRDSRLIRASASFDASDGNPAGLLTLARLVRALTAWSAELRTADKAGLDPSTVAKVSTAPDELKPAVQLAVQTILQQHVVPATQVGGAFGLALVGSEKIVSLAEASEVLLALIEVESRLLASEFLRGRILQLLDWYAGDLLGKPADVSSRDLIWIRTVAQAARAYDDERTGSWAGDVVQYADNLLQQEAP